MTNDRQRTFLGWDRPLVPAAAAWLLERRGPDLGPWVVALPGARAGRRLRLELARRAGPHLVPPRILTAGALTDSLVRLASPAAGRLERTLAWQRALRELPPRRRAALVPRAPDPDDLRGWMRLAEEVRRLFGELAADGLDFRQLAEGPARPQSEGEARRFEALADAQQRMCALLAEGGRVDPHLGRLAALEAGHLTAPERVVLVGVADVNVLLRRALEGLAAPIDALVGAPPELADDFDALGCLRVEAWCARELDLPLERWHVVDGPAQQGAAVARVLAGWEGRFAAEEITIGVADAEVAPHLRRRLARTGVAVRDAAGAELSRSAPARLLAAAARFLRSRSFADYAALLRHPDLEAALRARPELCEAELADWLDDYQARHLPARVDGDWAGDRATRTRLEAVHRALEALLGELAQPAPRALAQWSAAARRLLVEVYGARDLSAAARERDEGTRALGHALSALGEGLAELEALPANLSPEAGAAEALELLLRGLRGRAVPPPAPRPGEPTVELLGWLELALDDAPALVVSGFEDGRVPEALHGDAFLPDGLRRRLGLVDNRRRLARDVYAAHLMLSSRDEAHFVSGRRSAAGDPLLPSRLAFHCPPARLVERMRHALEPAGRGAPAPSEEGPGAPRRVLPRRAGAAAPEALSVTSFRTYLQSPYLFYLQHVLGLDRADDRARELDPLGFGILAHHVLQSFGRSELRDAQDEAPIAQFLHDELQRRARRMFGAAPLPAVALQIEQLDYRLRHFAARQAQRARDGWRIEHCEWAPAGGGVEFEVDGRPVQLRGQIDRVDRHPERGWAIFDYKTGERPERPRAAHLGRGEHWKDLQLPLYCLLASELDMGELPQVGYVTLGRQVDRIDFAPFQGWSDELLESALEAARGVVRAIRSEAFFDLGRGLPRDEILQAIAGVGLLVGAGTGEEDADGEGAGEDEE